MITRTFCVESLANGIALRRRQLQTHPLLYPGQRGRDVDGTQGMGTLAKLVQGTGDADLRQEQGLEIKPRLLAPGFAHQFLLAAAVLHGGGHDGTVDAGQRRGLLHHGRFRVAHVPFLAELLQPIAQGGPGPQRRGTVEAQSDGQFVGRLKTDAPDVGRQAIGVGPHQIHSLFAVRLIDAHRPGRADAVRLQENHDASHGFLLTPALADALDPASADALHLLEEAGTLVDDGQGAFPEDLDDLVGQVGTNALDQAGTKVLFDPAHGVRRSGAQGIGLEL